MIMDNWLEVIDKIKYFREYDAYEYENEERPSEKVVFEACKMALRLSEGPPPMRVITGGNNGISFEWASGYIFETINIENNEVEHIIFSDCKIVDRYKIKT
jgi:hypothetical protein